MAIYVSPSIQPRPCLPSPAPATFLLPPAPATFICFQNWKKRLARNKYETRAALISAVNRYLSSKSTSWFAEGIQKIAHVYRRRRAILSLWKHAYSNILKISPPKTENFQIKNLWYFHISAQNIDCGYSLEPPRRGGSNEYPQYMFLAEIKKIMYTPVNPSFTI